MEADPTATCAQGQSWVEQNVMRVYVRPRQPHAAAIKSFFQLRGDPHLYERFE